jgi:hypothetical protein
MVKDLADLLSASMFSSVLLCEAIVGFAKLGAPDLVFGTVTGCGEDDGADSKRTPFGEGDSSVLLLAGEPESEESSVFLPILRIDLKSPRCVVG